MFRPLKLLCLLLVITVFDFSPRVAIAQTSGSGGGGSDFSQRSARRESKRWTLQEWMEQKDRSRMMDMWLSMNSPSPYEFMFGGASINRQTDIAGGTGPTQSSSYQGMLSAYAQLVGLTGEYENNSQEGYNDLSGMFNLRLIGHTIQGSNLTLHYGQRTRNIDANQVRLSQQFAQGSLQLYLTKYFGFDGSYRQYLPTTENTLGDITGSQSDYGAFLDFKAFRIFGAAFKETSIYNNAGTETTTTRSGSKVGLKIFF